MTWKKIQVYGIQTAYKEILQPDGYTSKLIIKLIGKNMNKIPCGIFLVRDGRIVKYICKEYRRRPVPLSYWRNFLLEIGIKYQSIHSHDLGALYKKYNIPASARQLANRSTDPFRFCVYWADLCKLGFCPEQCNTIMAKSRSHNGINCLVQKFKGRIKAQHVPLWEKLSDKQKMDCFSYNHVYDLFNMHREIHEEAPELLEPIDYRESLQTLHDNFNRIRMRMNALKDDMVIPYNDRARELEQMAPEGFRIKLAEHGSD